MDFIENNAKNIIGTIFKKIKLKFLHIAEIALCHILKHYETKKMNSSSILFLIFKLIKFKHVDGKIVCKYAKTFKISIPNQSNIFNFVEGQVKYQS
jgi:hypothetical protein